MFYVSTAYHTKIKAIQLARIPVVLLPYYVLWVIFGSESEAYARGPPEIPNELRSLASESLNPEPTPTFSL